MKHERAPKTDFLQIRLSREDRLRITAASTKEHLEASTWARRVILHELDRLAAGEAGES
jgi:hypothetical protein